MSLQPVGSSDFTAAAEHYTYDDVPAGQTDFGLTHFSIAHDQEQVLPLLKQAKQLNPLKDGDAVEPAGLDEDRRLSSSAAGSRTTRRCTTPTRAIW